MSRGVYKVLHERKATYNLAWICSISTGRLQVNMRFDRRARERKKMVCHRPVICVATAQGQTCIQLAQLVYVHTQNHCHEANQQIMITYNVRLKPKGLMAMRS